MKQKRFNVEQIVAVLKQAEAGIPLAELIRRVSISEETFYRWKKQYVGLEVDQVRRPKHLQEENTRLKQLVTNLTLDKTMLQDVLSKIPGPSRGRQVLEYLHGSYQVSERRACRVARLNRGTFRYCCHKDPRTALRMRIREIAQTRVRYGYRKIRGLLNREGWKVGKYLVERLYWEEGLTLHERRKRRRRVAEHRRERFRPTGPDQVWSMDFVADQLAGGRRSRLLTVVDIHTRECLAIKSEQRLKGEDVVLALNRIKIQREVPKFVYRGTGSELSSQAMDLWESERSANGLFATGEDDRRCVRGIVQRNVSGGMSGCLSVHAVNGDPADRGELAQAVLRGSPSQGSRGENAQRIRQGNRGWARFPWVKKSEHSP